MEIVWSAHSGHIGGDLSCLNVLTALYHHYLNISSVDDPFRDRFVLSKGHCVESLYSVFESRGFLSRETLDTLGKYGSPLGGHPLRDVPGVEVNSGALGHGLSVGVGMALAGARDGASYKTVVLMGDGEQAEGSISEAAMAASHFKLGRLIAIIDRNMLQISGRTEDIMHIENLREIWMSMGWEVREMDGDDMASIISILDATDFSDNRPHLIISHSTKGKGVSYMENDAKWHHGIPSEEQYRRARTEIEDRIKRMEG